jgi:hypothetical protein
VGYAGGRWDNGRFFYNSAVNNLGAAPITNVYNSPVVNNTTINNTTINSTSFNGGPGGVVATPTAAQTLAAKDPHVPPTAAQRNQARMASVDRTQFVSTNQGKPVVAATERPGEFKGRGAVPAKAAGKAAAVTPAPAPAVTPPAGNVQPQGNPPPPRRR